MQLVDRQCKVLADVAATAWLNAAIAYSNEESRSVLYRTISVEFFRSGVQFVACDGTMLFRTWAPYSDIGDLPAPHPEGWELPVDSVVVMDTDKFALAFMRTLLAACGEVPIELTVTVEQAEDHGEPALGEEMTEYVLTLQALGQRLSCKLYEGRYPDWRALEFGLDAAERVDGMVLATRLFQSVGKLRGVHGIECEFHGESRAVEFRAGDSPGASVRGLLMPMRRTEKVRRSGPAESRVGHEDLVGVSSAAEA